jgi:colanic acid/amylovoran biosynthesis glycosyltransferase
MKTSTGAVALQRCDQFVGRTMNWLYDHLRFLPRYTPVVLCDWLLNRAEFSAMEARGLKREVLSRRLWRRVAGPRPYPTDRLWLVRRRPRLLHSHFGYVAAEDLALQRVLEVPWVVSFYGADVYQVGRLAEWQQRYLRVFEAADRVLALGPVMARHLARLGCPERKLGVHALGVDVRGLPSQPRTLQPGAPLEVLFAGTLREKKGIEYVVEGAARARRAGVRLKLHLVGEELGKPGDRETRDRVFRAIGRLGLADAVVHHPFLAFHQLVELALGAHVFAAPSVTAADGDAEGTPFVLQQMMATGMPAIATAHSDIPYVFGEHAHLLVPERDAGGIAERLQRYADDPDTLVTDGMALRERIRRAFDVRDRAGELGLTYDALRRGRDPEPVPADVAGGGRDRLRAGSGTAW